MPRKLTTEEFIKRSKKKHGNKYDYSLVEFKGIYKKVKIICPIHGIFEQIPKSHMKYECYECGHLKISTKKYSTTEEFIQKANEIHKHKYDYSLVNYKDAKTKVKIICPIHGIFEQIPCNHIHKTNKSGCMICGGRKMLNTKEFILKTNDIHKNKYDYSLVNYKNSHSKIKIFIMMMCHIYILYFKIVSSV
jgi:hypothetical protein